MHTSFFMHGSEGTQSCFRDGLNNRRRSFSRGYPLYQVKALRVVIYSSFSLGNR